MATKITIESDQTISEPVTVVVKQPGEPVEPPPSGEEGWDYPGLIDNGTIYQTPDIPLPRYLEPYTDQIFKTKVTRISGDEAPFARINKHHYMTDQPWNANGEMILLTTPMLLLDGNSFELIGPCKGVPGGGEIRWTPDDPKLAYYASGSIFGTWDPKAGTKETIKNFSGFSGLQFSGKSKLSDNGKMIAMRGTKDGRAVAFAFDIGTGTKHPDLALPSGVNAVRISATGKYLILGMEDENDYVYTLDGNRILILTPDQVSHYDTLLDIDGNDLLIGRARGAPYVGGEVYKIELPSGKQTKIQKRTGYQNHTSCTGGKEWTLTTISNEPKGRVYNDEMVLMKVDGSKNCRVGHTHTAVKPYSYDYEPQAVLDRKARRALFRTGWHDASAPVHVYCVEFGKPM